jgi:hypothetical protein
MRFYLLMAMLAGFFCPLTATSSLIQLDEMISKQGFEDHLCEARDDCYYVSPGASSASECSYTDPCDLLTAQALLSGGDHLYLLSGTYDEAHTFSDGAFGDYQVILAFGRFHAFADPQPSATQRITIKAYPGHQVVFDGQYDINTNLGAQCIYTDQGFMTFSGLVFVDCHTGINIGQNRINADVEQVVVQHNRFTGNHFVNDNGGHVTVYDFSLNVVVQNNEFAGPGTGIGSMNSAGIYFTHNRGGQYLHNDIHGHRTGVHYKHDHNPDIGDTGSVLAWNHIHDVDIAARLNNRHLTIHNNLVTESAGSFIINHCSGATGEGGDRNLISHNYFHSLTFNGCSDAANDQGAFQNTLRNNILMSRFYLHPWDSRPHATSMNHNLYVADVFNDNQAYDLTAWQVFYGQDQQSVSGQPDFVDPLLQNISDYRLLPGSVGHQAADDGLDMGPDIQAVGRIDL